MYREASRNWRVLVNRLIKAVHISQGICVAAIVALVFSVLSVAAGTPTAHAQNRECAGTWDNLKWEEGSGIKNGSYTNVSQFAVASFDWSVPDTAKAGETFTLKLPDQLKPASGISTSFELKDASGIKVADAVWEGKTLRITLADYANSRFNVKGQARVSLEWDRSGIDTNRGYDSKTDGSLNFTGCGNGGLEGVYPKDGPSGDTHENAKRGQYDGEYVVEGTSYYLTRWTVYVDGRTKGTDGINDFTVTDTAPDGHKFVCDSKYNRGLIPTEVGTFYQSAYQRDRIIDADERNQGGYYAGVTANGMLHTGYGFELNCSANQLTVRFPYGVSPNSGPLVNFYTYTTERPQPFSTQKNTAYISDKQVEGFTYIPGADGSGSGNTGGFSIKKVVMGGAGAQIPASFKFNYKCVRESMTLENTIEVSPNNGFVHVKDIEKGMRCEITEVSQEATAPKPRLTWEIDGKPADKAEFEARSPEEKSIDLIAINTYDSTPKTGTFTITKKVSGWDEEKAKGKEFTFSYQCEAAGHAEVKGEIQVKGNAQKTPVSQQIPVGAKCKVTEKTDSAQIEGYSLKTTVTPEEVTITDTEGDNAVGFEAVNQYEKTAGTFRIEKQLVGAEGVVKQLEDREFTFKYTCGNDAEATAKVSKNKPFESSKQYPLGTECTVKEETAGTEVKDQKWSHTLTPADGKIKISAENTTKVVASNTYTPVPKGRFTVNKKIEGSAALLADESVQNRKFKGQYRCGTQDWTQFEFSVKEPFVSPEYPEETSCHIEEHTNSTEIPGFTWSGANDNKEELSILRDNNANIQVELINKYTQKVGGFKLTKFVDGPAASLAKDIEYKFDYVCGEKTGSLKVKEGQTVDGPTDIPINTNCTITESEVDVPAGVTWLGTLPNGGKFTIKEGETVDIHAKNTFEHSKGGFSILKTVGGDASDLDALKSKQYEFTYVCEQPNGQPVKGSISTTPGKSVTVKDILVGSECKVTETQSDYPNVDWLVEFSGEGVEVEGNKATFRIADHNKPSVNLKAKNTFTQYKGGFSLEKTVAAEDGIKTPQKFDFTWTCGNVNGEVKVSVENGKGSVDVSEEIPVGTSCVVVEKDAKVAGTELVTEWKNQRFTIGKKSEIVRVSAKNTYTHETGGFLIEKQIIGGARDKAADKTFTFDYVCTKDGKEVRKASTQIRGEGRSELIDALPVGTECHIEEQDAKISGTQWKHTISDQGKFKISSAHVTYKVTVVNGYESLNFLPILPLIPLIPLIPFIVGPSSQPPVITPVAPMEKNPTAEKPREVKTASKRDKPSLAKTGANTLGIALAAFLLVGMGMLLVRRNRRNTIATKESTQEIRD